jgi:hypothetical protein
MLRLIMCNIPQTLFLYSFGFETGCTQQFGRGAMSETQSEQYTTPEFAATLSLPGGRTSLGTSPLAEHAAALNDVGRRTLQVCCHVEPDSKSHTRILLVIQHTPIFPSRSYNTILRPFIPEATVSMFPKRQPQFGPTSLPVEFVVDKVGLMQSHY